MSAREPRYNTQEALERIWNNSGDEEDFELNRMRQRVKLKVTMLMSLHQAKKILLKDSKESSNDEASNGRDGGN